MDDSVKDWSEDYLFVPMAILSEAFHDQKGTMKNALDYCFYCCCAKLEGSLEDRFEEILSQWDTKCQDPLRAYNNGKAIFDSIPEKSPKASIKRDLVFEYLKQPKSEFQIVCFLANAAIKSILQRQKYKKITNRYLISRMAGNSNASDPLPDWAHKYVRKHQLDKIKLELQLNWKLKLYGSEERGFFVSFAKNLDDLAAISLVKKRSNRIKNLREMKKEAKIRALRSLEEWFKSRKQ